MRVAIIGSRDYPRPEDIVTACEYLQEACPGWILVSGGARGPDSWAEKYAWEHGIQAEIYRADWDRFGKKAGMIRNREIVGTSDLVIAFWDGTSRGTAHSINLAALLGIPCWVVRS